MYICDCSRSVGAGKAMTRKTRGLTRSVMALIVPPLPAPSRPSNTMQTFSPLCRTHSCNFTSSTWSLLSSRSYSLPLSFVRSAAAAFALIVFAMFHIKLLSEFRCRDAYRGDFTYRRGDTFNRNGPSNLVDFPVIVRTEVYQAAAHWCVVSLTRFSVLAWAWLPPTPWKSLTSAKARSSGSLKKRSADRCKRANS